MSAVPLRSKVLAMYRTIIRTGRTWPNVGERAYIISEARALFHANSGLKESSEIETKLTEAEHRLALGVHYKIPYPRAFYVAPDNVGVTKKRRGYAVNPTYLNSYIQHMPTTPPPAAGATASA